MDNVSRSPVEMAEELRYRAVNRIGPSVELSSGEAFSVAAVLLEARESGRREVLRRVAQLPNPVHQNINNFTCFSCSWCRKSWYPDVNAGDHDDNWRDRYEVAGLLTHPANGCLWPEAQAVVREEGQ